jgi:hypothetical protein
MRSGRNRQKEAVKRRVGSPGSGGPCGRCVHLRNISSTSRIGYSCGEYLMHLRNRIFRRRRWLWESTPSPKLGRDSCWRPLVSDWTPSAPVPRPVQQLAQRNGTSLRGPGCAPPLGAVLPDALHGDGRRPPQAAPCGKRDEPTSGKTRGSATDRRCLFAGPALKTREGVRQLPALRLHPLRRGLRSRSRPRYVAQPVNPPRSGAGGLRSSSGRVRMRDPRRR